MPFQSYVSLFSAGISFVGLMLVLLQLRHNARQRSLDSLLKVYDINRQLLTLGFSHPKLFSILADAEDADPV